MKTTSGSSSAISSLQRVVNAGRGSASTVSNIQRLLNASKCLVAAVCSPQTSIRSECAGTIPQKIVKSGRGCTCAFSSHKGHKSW